MSPPRADSALRLPLAAVTPVATHPTTRASDADRARTVDLLQEHWLAGRLTLVELETRTDQAWRARRVDELWQALRELPIALPASHPPPPQPRHAGGSAIASLVLGVTGLVVLLLSLGFLAVVSLPVSTTAWLVGRSARRGAPPPGPHGTAVAGEVLGATGAVLACVAVVGCAVVIAGSQ